VLSGKLYQTPPEVDIPAVPIQDLQHEREKQIAYQLTLVDSDIKTFSDLHVMQQMAFCMIIAVQKEIYFVMCTPLYHSTTSPFQNAVNLANLQ